MANSINASTLRLVGLSSGMDTDSIIQNMLLTQQTKINRQIRSRIQLEWKQNQLNEINDRLKDFQNTYLKRDSPKSILGTSNLISYKATTTDTSGAVSLSIDSGGTIESSVSISVTQLAERAEIRGDDLQTDRSTALGESGRIYINGTDYIDVVSTDSLDDIVTKINDLDIGITAYYSELSGGLILRSDETGADQSIALTDDSGGALLTNLGFSTTSATGQNAKGTINGVSFDQSSNSFTFDGITYTLHDETNGTIRFDIGQDYQYTMDVIKEFIEAYNELIYDLYSMTRERPDNDYYPLVDSEKEEMTEEEIAKWEEIAQQGMLYGDSDLERLVSGMRNAFYTTIDSAGMSLSQMGLNVAYGSSSGGVIEIDEDKLMDAIMNNSDALVQAFSSVDDRGLAWKLGDLFDDYTTMQGYTLDSMDTQIKNLNDKIEKMEKKLVELEEKYYLKFAAMETALAKLNSQYDAIASFFTY